MIFFYLIWSWVSNILLLLLLLLHLRGAGGGSSPLEEPRRRPSGQVSRISTLPALDYSSRWGCRDLPLFLGIYPIGFWFETEREKSFLSPSCSLLLYSKQFVAAFLVLSIRVTLLENCRSLHHCNGHFNMEKSNSCHWLIPWYL